MHRVIQNHLEAYLDGALMPVYRRDVDAHLKECRSCREEVDDLRQTHEWMRVLVLEQPESPAPGFYARIRMRVEAEADRRAWPFWQLLPAFSRQLGYAVMILVLLLGTYLFSFHRVERRAAEQFIADAPAIRTETPTLTSDNHVNRERVMRAIVAPLGSVEGD
jgi:predicted anti-sigma-YlaC factor YlaD